MSQLSPHAQRRALAWSVVEGSIWAVMIGVSESYLSVLAVELGFSNADQATLTTVPLLAGALAQLASPSLAVWLGGRKRLVIAGAVVQAGVHLAFASIARHGDNHLGALLSAKVLYWVAGSVMAPPWNAWMADLTEGVSRERYFATRSAINQAVLLVAFLGAGVWLEVGRRQGVSLSVLATLSLVALGCRLLSAACLWAQAEAGAALPPRGWSWAALSDTVRDSDWRVPIFVALFMAAGHVSIPFFVPYMRRDLGMDFVTFALVSAVSMLSKALTYSVWRRTSERYGLRRTLILGAVGAASMPLWWALSRNLSWLIAAQVVSGVVWGAFEYASFQILLVSAPEQRRGHFLAVAGSLTGLLQLGGGLLGSLGLDGLGLTYQQLFALGSVARGLSLFLLISPWRLLGQVRARGRLLWRGFPVRPG